jgi:hypothetical protein
LEGPTKLDLAHDYEKNIGKKHNIGDDILCNNAPRKITKIIHIPNKRTPIKTAFNTDCDNGFLPVKATAQVLTNS